MDSENKNISNMSLSRKRLFIWSTVVAVLLAGFFANKAIQSHLGKEVLNSSGLEVLSLQQALEKAKNKHRLVLADMSAIWCPTCRKLDKQVFSDEVVKAEIDKNFVFARIEYDSEEGKAFVKKHYLIGFPNLLVLNVEGEKLVHLPLTFDPTEFTLLLKQAAKDHSYAIKY